MVLSILLIFCNIIYVSCIFISMFGYRPSSVHYNALVATQDIIYLNVMSNIYLSLPPLPLLPLLQLPSPAGAGGLTLPMLQQPYAAVQTPTGLSYMPLPMALNLQQQQQQIESRNKVIVTWSIHYYSYTAVPPLFVPTQQVF